MIAATKYTVEFEHLTEIYETEVAIFKQTEEIDYTAKTRTINNVLQTDIDKSIINHCGSVVMRKFIPVDLDDIVVISVIEGFL